jgi:hypothetical protein
VTGAGSAAALRIARWILQRYPRAWRERYNDEVCALLDDGRGSWADVADLLRGCASEWKGAIADPEDHPRVFQFLTGLEALCRGLIKIAAFLLPAVATAEYLRRDVGPAPEWVGTLGVVVYVLLMTAMWLAMRRQNRSGRVATAYGMLSASQLRWWVPLAMVTVAVILWADGLPDFRASLSTAVLSRWLQVMMIVMFFLSATHRPRFGMLDLASEMGSRRYLLRWAKLEVARCESLDPRDSTRARQLASAQAEVDRLNRELQDIYGAIRERRPLELPPSGSKSEARS